MSASAPASAPASSSGYQYDLLVVGGGSGGVACAKEAGKLGARVLLLDYVKPSVHGRTWGVGGTCVNVGCIPKKLFHHGALLREHMRDAPFYGYTGTEALGFDWPTLQQAVNDHIRSINWATKEELESASVEYVNAFGRFVDAHTIEATDSDGQQRTYTADKIVVAVGGRPKYPGVRNDHLCISSDDVFALPSSPGPRVLVVGASYVALECAGFLAGLGLETTVMARSILLRGFDQGIAERIGAHMAAHGVRFLRPAVPTGFEQVALDGDRKAIDVEYRMDGAPASSPPLVAQFDTVLMAVGREVSTGALALGNAGVNTASDGKIPVIDEQTNVPNIFAIGDCVQGVPELTPTAIKAGQLLARRLFGGSTMRMDYSFVPTTVFTPLEYGSVGLSEEAARKRYGDANVDAYHLAFKPLEAKLNWQRFEEESYIKVVVNTADSERIIGLHFLGPSAGEVTQGWALALKMGATKAQLDGVIGIHPTNAEKITTLKVTVSSGDDAAEGGC